MPDDVSLFAAFFASVLSFVSPCVLPLVPGYLSFVSGMSLEKLTAGGTGSESGASRQVFFASLAFVAGFSVVFVALGATASTVGRLLYSQLGLLNKIAGAIVIIFGLHTMGVLRIPFLYREARIDTKTKPAGLFGAFVVGLAFAFGWTPCIGPILGAILALAAEEGTVHHGMLLLLVYSLGLGIPFLVTSLAVNQFFSALKRVRRYYHAIELVAGGLMVVIGVLIMTNRFSVITRALTPYLPTF
jgi:cytochrome c-type biogenesis protein